MPWPLRLGAGAAADGNDDENEGDDCNDDDGDDDDDDDDGDGESGNMCVMLQICNEHTGAACRTRIHDCLFSQCYVVAP